MGLSDGTVKVPTVLHTYTLRPTLRAMQTICEAAGDWAQALTRCARYDVRMVCIVVAAGAGLTGKKAIEDCHEAVFKTGLDQVVPLCLDYLEALQRGGRPADAPEPPDAEGNA